MNWQEQMKEISKKLQLEEKDDFSINTTGAVVNEKNPDGLFYNQFTEEEAKEFFKIFQDFSDTYNTQYIRNCTDKLYDELSELLNKMDGLGAEVMLYASRTIKGHIDGNVEVLNTLVDLTAKYLVSEQALKYIASGWEWPTQLKIVIEACGKTGYEDYISIMMDNYRRIVGLFPDVQTDLIRSYLNMILTSQSEKSVEYLIKIVRSSAFMNNPANYKLLTKPIMNSQFMKSEENLENFKKGVLLNSLSPEFKFEFNKRVNRESNVLFNGWDFGKKSPNTLSYFKGVKDTEVIKIGIDKFIENIDNIPQSSVKSQTYYTIGQKAALSNDEIYKAKARRFLRSELASNEDFTVGIKLGLLFVEVDSKDKKLLSYYMDQVFDLIISEDEYLGRETVAQFFRYRKDCFALFVNYLMNKIGETEDLNDIINYADLLKYMCDQYSNNFVNETHSVNNILELIKYIIATKLSRSIIRNCLDVIGILIEYSTVKSKAILLTLDSIKGTIENYSDYRIYIQEVNKLIQKADRVAPPM